VTSVPLVLLSRPDLVVISVPPGESTIGPYILSKGLGKKVIVDYRDEWEDHLIGISKAQNLQKLNIFIKKLMTKYYKKCNCLITVTDSLLSSLAKRGIRNIHVLPNGADCNIFKPQTGSISYIRETIGFTKDDFIIVYSGVIGEYYDLDVVIRAMNKILVEIPKIKLLIIGYGSNHNIEKLKQLSENLGISDHIRFMDAKLDKNELSRIIACGNAGIVPYNKNALWNNSLPVKSFEYFACGLPVIATVNADSQLGKLILDNDIGMICKPENVVELAETIVNMYRSDIRSFNNRSVSLIRQQFNRETIAQRLRNLIEATVNE
jgi:glycosyltransferase involved in cell wall biosynthesis